MTTEQILENIDLKLVETTVEGAYVRVYFHSKRKSRSYTYNVLLDNELFDYLKNFRDGINNEGMFNYEGAKDYTADDNPNAKHCAYVHATLIWHYMQPFVERDLEYMVENKVYAVEIPYLMSCKNYVAKALYNKDKFDKVIVERREV